MAEAPSTYQAWHLLVPRAHEDALTADFWQHGTLGIEVREPETADATHVLLIAYFAAPPNPEDEAPTPFDLDAWTSRGITVQSVQRFSDADWMAAYRAQIEPLAIGRFVVHSGEPETSAEAGNDDPDRHHDPDRYHLRIPARTAFGTGSHESTRLTLACMESLDLDGLRILDVGTGSGILAFAGQLLGAGQVVAYDLESQSVCVARTNATLNSDILEGRVPAFFAGTVQALRHGTGFDLALVNVLPERILPHYPDVLSCLRPDGMVISSGNLITQRDELLQRFAAWYLQPEDEQTEGDWVAWTLRRRP